MAFRGIDLLDVYRGRLSMRRLRVLITHLPPESATKTAMRNATPPEEMARASKASRPDLAPWSGTEMLLASLLDAVRHQTNVLAVANGGKQRDIEPTPRPGVPPKHTTSAKRGLTDDQRRAIDPRLRNQPKEA